MLSFSSFLCINVWQFEYIHGCDVCEFRESYVLEPREVTSDCVSKRIEVKIVVKKYLEVLRQFPSGSTKT